MDDLAARWWEFQRRQRGTRAERTALEGGEPREVHDAYDEVAAVVERGGRRAIDLIAELTDAMPADESLATVGAGPLEGLLVEHGDELIDLVVERARRSPCFASALSAVWLEPAEVSESTRSLLSTWVDFGEVS